MNWPGSINAKDACREPHSKKQYEKNMTNLNGLGVSFYSTSEMALCILPALVSQVVG